MKLYYLWPGAAVVVDRTTTDEEWRAHSERMADLIAPHLASDPALFAVRHLNEVSKPTMPMDMPLGYAEAARITNREALLQTLRAAGDPTSGRCVQVRSLVTCRAVFYGHDGQAFVCLPEEAAPIVSPDEDLIGVEERSRILIETDWMDGLNAL